MGKAILVLDNMPKNCVECPLLETDRPICLATKTRAQEEYMPGTCPLKDAPEYLNNYRITDEDIENLEDEYKHTIEYMTGHEDGWNDCLKEIIGTRD